MRHALCIVVIVALSGAAHAADLKEAHSLLMRGRYAEAADIYRPEAEHSVEAALGLARVYQETGKLDAAVKTLQRHAEKSASVQAMMAELAFNRGDLNEAKARADAALKLSHDLIEARFVLAELDRVQGKIEEAEKGYRHLIDLYNNTEVTKPDKLRCVGLAAAHVARWNRLSGQFDFIVNELYPQSRKLDANYWPSRYEEGRLFLEKYNGADAIREFNEALDINPRAASVLVAKASLDIERHQEAEAKRSLDRALEINPSLIAAWQLKADIALAQLDTAKALRILEEKARPLCPSDEETLGRIAGCYLLLDQTGDTGPHSRFGRLLAEVEHRNSRAAEFYSTLADVLESRFKLAEAEHYFREAHRVMPRHVGPLAELGLLMMRMGREREARKLLDEAFDADPFHVRVKNMLEVLDVLDSMKTLETDHFILRYDPASQRMADLVAPQLEAIHDELQKLFGYEPPTKTPVELFATTHGQDGHGWFSARVIGLPYLDTVAASTGGVVAMVSPDEPNRAFNWRRVLKHEMTHVFNLQQSHFNIPHWFAEGVAVANEGGRRPYTWTVMLRRRAAKKELFTLDDIDIGFTRAMSGDDCQMAYCQGELYIEYMRELGGPRAIQEMLEAYAAGPETYKAINSVFKMSQAEFEQGYADFISRRLKSVPSLAEPDDEKVEPLEKLHRKNPDDANVAARLACAYLENSATDDAAKMAQAALKIDLKQPLAAAILVRLHKSGSTDDSIKLLRGALDRKSPHPLVLSLLGNLLLKTKHYEEAVDLFLLGQKYDPENPKWIAALARVYIASNETKRLGAVLEQLAEIDVDDLTARKKLAEMALVRRDAATARRWAEQSLLIKTNDAEVHRLLAAALVEQSKFVPAIAEYEAAVEFSPKNLQIRMSLADACIQAEKIGQAKTVLKDLLEVDRKFAGAASLLESLNDKKQAETEVPNVVPAPQK